MENSCDQQDYIVRDGLKKREDYGRGGGPKCSNWRPDQGNKWRALLKS